VRTMKVWYIVMKFPFPSETFVANDVRALKQLGVDISVHALRGPRRDAERLLQERGFAGLEVTHGTASNVFRGLLLGLARPRLAGSLALWVIRHSGGRPVHVVKGLALLPRMLELFKRLELDPPDVVHVFWGHYPATFGWLVREHAPDVVVSLSLVAYDLACDFPGSMAVARRAHLVSTCAAANVPAIARGELSPESVHVYLHGIDHQKVGGRLFEKVTHRVVTAGRLVAHKAMEDVIRAFARVAAEYPNAELVILGDGPERQRLEEFAATLGVANAITFRGHVPHHEVFEELAQAELFIFLSSSERLPNVVKEAMACRCLVVTTATLGIEELLADGVHGWVVPSGAWEQAAERALRAFSDPESSRAMAAEAQKHVLEKFDLLRLMREMVQKWEELRARHGSSPTRRRSPGYFPSARQTDPHRTPG
jgi:glycosyltransferase involved in cell wall biosynthesis